MCVQYAPRDDIFTMVDVFQVNVHATFLISLIESKYLKSIFETSQIDVLVEFGTIVEQ